MTDKPKKTPLETQREKLTNQIGAIKLRRTRDLAKAERVVKARYAAKLEPLERMLAAQPVAVVLQLSRPVSASGVSLLAQVPHMAVSKTMIPLVRWL